MQAVVLEDGDVHHGGEHQRQRRGAREPALGLHQEHGQGHHPDDEHDDREVEPEGVGVVVHGFGRGKRVVSRPRSSPAACRSAHENAANARSSRATRGGREEKARGADGVETPETARVLCPGRVEKPFIRRHDTTRRPRFVSRRARPTRRIVRPRAPGDFGGLERAFSSPPATRASRTRLRPFVATRVTTSERTRKL